MMKSKVYCETSFWSYLPGRRTSDEKIARWQSLTLKWFEQELPLCEVFVSDYVLKEAEIGNADQVAKRLELLRHYPKLDPNPDAIVPIAEKLIAAHALPEGEVTDALHIATAAYHGAGG